MSDRSLSLKQSDIDELQEKLNEKMVENQDLLQQIESIKNQNLVLIEENETIKEKMDKIQREYEQKQIQLETQQKDKLFSQLKDANDKFEAKLQEEQDIHQQ